MTGIDYTELTESQLHELIEQAQAELGRRQTEAAFAQQVADLYKEGETAGVIPVREDGTPWEPATGYGGVYQKGAIHTHNGKTWVSLIDFNAGEPGVSGWREKVGEGEYVVWKRPGGYEDAYAPGEIVWHPAKGDQLYKNIHTDKNAWEPGTPHSQWEPWEPVS